MKKILSLLLALSMAISLTACRGENPPAPGAESTPTSSPSSTDGKSGGQAEIALITDANSVDDRGYNQFSWEGIVKYAEENNITHTYYTPLDLSTEHYLTAIEGAVNNGAKVVVTAGFLFGNAIYQAQANWPDVKFIFIDGTPSNEANETLIGENTYSIFFAEEQAGFLAGYAAVQEGYRSLGFLGARAVPAVVRFGYGYVQGAEYAGKELGLAEDAISMMYSYTGSFENSPEAQAKAAAWYQNGTECVFGCGIPDSVFAACESVGGDKVSIGVDSDMSEISETCITSAMKMLSPAVYDALTRLYDGKFPGGTSATLDVHLEAVGIPMETSRFKNFTQAQYDAIVETLKADKDGVASTMKRESDKSGSEITIEQVMADLTCVAVQVVE